MSDVHFGDSVACVLQLQPIIDFTAAQAHEAVAGAGMVLAELVRFLQEEPTQLLGEWASGSPPEEPGGPGPSLEGGKLCGEQAGVSGERL